MTGLADASTVRVLEFPGHARAHLRYLERLVTTEPGAVPTDIGGADIVDLAEHRSGRLHIA